MSFITKRERVFNEYDLFDLPPRNEGKLKAYASCTDTRAWSHFSSDKSENLVEIIKRNNDTCRPKYLPTEVIVNTLLANKHAEIGRLQRKIEEFEQMLAAYDALDLTSEQRLEIAKAHAAIKEANKDLNELWFDLDLSCFTGIDSEDFETGKSRGDEPSRYRDELDESGDEPSKFKGDRDDRSRRGNEPSSEKGSQKVSSEKGPDQKDSKKDNKLTCDACTSAEDPRIQELQECIVIKDAKINALRNTKAVIENDVCEPYCIYAHIYTALEKIFGVLCQNEKYKVYLNLMTAGKDIQCIDIKGKIFFKLKVLEKFTIALLAPCSQNFVNHQSYNEECSCYRAEIVASVETAYALMSADTQEPSLDSKRTKLVADIMENEEMKEILSKDNTSYKTEFDDEDANADYNIDQENLKRLKNLQENYDDLMNCYENLKHEKDCLQIRCRKYDELEEQCVTLQTQLREYNLLWSEKEHYQKRSSDLDTLKEQYLVLCDETTNLETELKAEIEINKVKTKTIDELRSDNKVLEKKLNEASIAFEKERNCAHCRLKESECTIMCQGQQIKSLSVQIDRLLEQDPDKLQSKPSETPAIDLIDEINSLKEQIKNLQDALYCSEEEKQQLQEEYQNKLNLINEIKMEIEDWKSNYEKALQRNDYLEKYTDSFREKVHKLKEENRNLTQDVEEKSKAIENLICMLNNKSQEVSKLMEDVELKTKKNNDLYAEINSLHNSYNRSVSALDTEKSHVERSLHIARQESHELLEKIKDYDDQVHKHNNLLQSYQKQSEEYNELKALLISTKQENETLQMDLTSREHNNSILLQEIQRLQEVNNFALSNINSLQDEKNHYKHSLELTKKDSKMLEDKINIYEDLSHQMQQLQDSHEKLIKEKNRLENELIKKSLELDDATHTINLTTKVSEELKDKLQTTENLRANLRNVDNLNKNLIQEQKLLQSELNEKKQEFKNLLESYNNLKNNLKKINDQSSEENEELFRKFASLKNSYNELLAEKNALQNDYDGKTEELNELYNALESKIDDYKELSRQLQQLELNHKTVQNSMTTLQEDHCSTKNTLLTLRKESDKQMQRIKYYEKLESEHEQLKKDYQQVKEAKNKLQKELDMQTAALRKVSEDNEALNSESQHLLSHSEDLEKALINARIKLIENTGSLKNPHIDIDIIKEIEEIRKEKIANKTKITDLLVKLDKSENIISDLSEDIVTRDDKIAILENHINQLQDEVRRLHSSLGEIVDIGEQIKDNSYKKIKESLNTMDAHHSKATHNMKIEIAKLQHDNFKLEERLSINKIKTEDSTRDKHKYVSQIIHLQNEREIIVTDIKQLEIKSVGDSALSPDHCDVEDVLRSLDRIRCYFDTRSSKSASLEQTLQKLQNSYQVVQSKADEAKKIVEKEKQKILNEKEEAIRDRVNMEKQLADLKGQLEKQVSHDRNIIKDLEAEILNQKLIFEKLNESTQSYISKLKEEMQSLQELYQKSLENISTIEKRLRLMTDEKNTHLDIIENINIKLEEKSKEIDILNQDLEKLKNKSTHNLGTQVYGVNSKDEQTQTSEEFLYEGFDQYDDAHKLNNFDENSNFDRYRPKTTAISERKIIQIDKTKQAKKVQVLTANVEPTLDYVRNSYLNYKSGNLSPECVEQYSNTCISEDNTELDNKDTIQPIFDKYDKNSTTNQNIENGNVIDIYNKQSMHTYSSKIIDSNNPENEDLIKSPDKISNITDFGLTIESFGTKSSQNKASNLFGPVSEISTDQEDLFIIYKDSEINKVNDKKSWPPNTHSKTKIENVTIYTDKDSNKSGHASNKIKQSTIESDTIIYLKDTEIHENGSIEHKKKTSLPAVKNNIPTMDTASDGDKKSLDSYTMHMYPSPKSSCSSDHKIEKEIENKGNKHKSFSSHFINDNEIQSCVSTEDENLKHTSNKKQKLEQSDSNSFNIPSGSTQINELSNENTSLCSTYMKMAFVDNVSHHLLSRIDADVHLIKSKAAHPSIKAQDKPDNFGLDFILATVQMDPDNIKTYSAADSLRKTRSDELLGSTKLQRENNSSPSGTSEFQKSSTDNKAEFSNNRSSNISQSKTYMEQSVMVTLYSNEEYEKQVKHLTKKLEHIEKDYKKKIEAIKMQYDNNIKSILTEHNEGVQSIQGLHEETLQDIIKQHENEVENLRSMSIEAMKKADKLEKEVRSLKCRMQVCSTTCLNEDPMKISSPEFRKHRESRVDTKTLTKTNVEAFNVRPKSRSNGPCTCSLDINISDTIRNIFEQVDVEQKKVAEHTYVKYIANKILNSNIEALDCQELSFLHLKVCRIWKVKFTKEGTLQKMIETEPMTKQRLNQHNNNLSDLDRKLAEERIRLQEAREAVCRVAPKVSRFGDPESEAGKVSTAPAHTSEIDYPCKCNPIGCSLNVAERRSTDDGEPVNNASGIRPKRVKPESNRAVLAKLSGERPEKKLYNDELPTRLRRPSDRQVIRNNKK